MVRKKIFHSSFVGTPHAITAYQIRPSDLTHSGKRKNEYSRLGAKKACSRSHGTRFPLLAARRGHEVLSYAFGEMSVTQTDGSGGMPLFYARRSNAHLAIGRERARDTSSDRGIGSEVD